jgi:hypothetical protein
MKNMCLRLQKLVHTAYNMQYAPTRIYVCRFFAV